MIKLDKYIFRTGAMGQFVDLRDAERWFRHWETHPGFEKLDTIRGTEAEMDKLVSVLSSTDRKTSDLLENPALEEFELVVRDPIPSMAMTVVRFKKSVLPKKPFVENGKDGAYAEYIPYVDAFISFRDKENVDLVLSLFSFHMYDGDGIELVTGTAQRISWMNEDFPLGFEAAQRDKEFNETLRDIKLIYLAIENAMNDKPVVFTMVSEHPRRTQKNSEGNHRKRRSVKVVKTIRLVPEELQKYAEPHRHMTCPCWGVIGHWRTYKSGKQVWIAPYKKGKERGNPSAYCPKDYVLEDK